jgi:hypothetical protein
MSKEIFLVDSNTFIEPYKMYYPFDLAPTFWDFVKLNIENGNIAVLSKVFDEVDKGGDSLSDWLQKLVFTKIDHRTQDVREVYKQIMSHIQNSKSQTGTELYNDKALQEWADNNRADAWLVATGKAKGYTIILSRSKTTHLARLFALTLKYLMWLRVLELSAEAYTT